MNKEKNQWREEMATLIEAMLEKNKPSEELIKIKNDEPFFEDSCRFVGLYFQLKELVTTFRSLNHFSKMISEKSANVDNEIK